MAGLLQPMVHFLAQNQRQETAENMASDRFISLMENRPRIQNGFHITENMLHIPEFFVLEGYLFRRKRGIGLENPLPVELRL